MEEQHAHLLAALDRTPPENVTGRPVLREATEEETGEVDRNAGPRTPAHMLFYSLLPGLEELVHERAEKSRDVDGWERRTVSEAEFAADAEIMAYLSSHARREVMEGSTPEWAAQDAMTIASCVRMLVDFETHLRKTFWVDESLAWALLQTDLDIEGACLRLPFPASAFVFSDRGTLELCESLLSQEDDCRLRGRPIQQLTVHVGDGGETAAGGRVVYLGFLFDGGDGGWPYLVTRDLHVRPDHDLAAILESHVPEVTASALASIFHAPELRKLVHLTINAILYAVSWQTRRSHPQGRQGHAPGTEPSAPARPGEVFHLPGRIPISALARLRDLERTESGRTIMKRFMVRGHWRRPNPDWKEQHLRWIEPYWKGPDIGVVIEREYRMRP